LVTVSVHRSYRRLPENELDTDCCNAHCRADVALSYVAEIIRLRRTPGATKKPYRRFLDGSSLFWHYSLGGISALLLLPILISNSDDDPPYFTSHRECAHEAHQKKLETLC
jgi:hypothetical protein